jgi:hypothetical protein
MQAMLAVAPTITLEEVHAICRSFFSFAADYSREIEAIADAAENPGKYYPPGPVRTTSVIACVPSFVTESGDAIEGGVSARAGATMYMSGHLDGSEVDMDAVVQPGTDDFDPDEMAIPSGSVKCASPTFMVNPWIASPC